MTDTARDFLRSRLPGDPEVLIVLGSGLGPLAEEVEDPVRVPFRDIPGHPGAGVAGHRGEYVFGTVEGRALLLQSGRIHLYEGAAPAATAFPVRLAAEVGVQSIVLTNAAGGIDRRLVPGSLVLLDDHLSLMFRSPLVGSLRPGEERFPDMSRPYDPALVRVFLDAARSLEIPLSRGVYAGLLGPTYETPAEIRMLERMGADLVGMSTVPEVLAARGRGVPVVALSIVTNWAAGISRGPLSHDEVLEAGKRASRTVRRLVRAALPRLP